MLETIVKVKKWANERNIIKGSTTQAQLLKLMSEVGELADNVAKRQDIADDIGDCMVVLISIGEQGGGISLDTYAKQLSFIAECDFISLAETTPRAMVASLEQISVIQLMDAVVRLAYQSSKQGVTKYVLRCMMSLAEVAARRGLTLSHCLDVAYADIKDRKGIMRAGIFIKEQDAAYASAVTLLGKD